MGAPSLSIRSPGERATCRRPNEPLSDAPISFLVTLYPPLPLVLSSVALLSFFPSVSPLQGAKHQFMTERSVRFRFGSFQGQPSLPPQFGTIY